jgi:hydrogenase maturation protease
VNLDRVEKVAEAVLYEGYMLYPYRPSSVKNQQRWNFGVLCPESWCDLQQGSEASTMQTECLLKASSSSILAVKVRFLQLIRRSIGKLRSPGEERPKGVQPDFEPVDSLEVGTRTYRPWQEAVERYHLFDHLDPCSLSTLPPLQITFPAGKEFEYLRDEQGQAFGVMVREWQTLNAAVEFGAAPIRHEIVKITVGVRNLTAFDLGPAADRESALLASLVSAHTVLSVEQGEFLSLLDPPAGLESAVADCRNVGTWPVLVGDHSETMLSSPIILYDHPQIAPESAGNLFDATEIDEILSLRILTLTDEEKREVRQSDDRAREILDRTENMPDEQFMKLHGVLRGLTRLGEDAR